MICNQYNNKKIKLLAGFTAAELIVVIGIMLIFMSIGIPVFNGVREKEELTGAVRDLVVDIRYAQQLAITEQLYYGVKFISVNDDLDKYELFKYSSSTNPEVVQLKDLPEGIRFVSIDFSNSSVVFNPYGAADEQGSVTLSNSASNTSMVEVRPSGFVKIIQ